MWENCHDAEAYEEAVALASANEQSRSGRTQYVLVYAEAYHDGQWRLPLVLKDKPVHLAGCLNLPGGKVEYGENPVAAGKRELEEETGLVPWDKPVGMGIVRGNSCDIHCVRIPVTYGDIRPGAGETEKVAWYGMDSVLHEPQLMPNLRLVIPLMLAHARGWEIYDYDDNWRGNQHTVQLSLAAYHPTWEPITVVVKGLSYYKGE